MVSFDYFFYEKYQTLLYLGIYFNVIIEPLVIKSCLFISKDIIDSLKFILESLGIIVPLLLAVAFYTLLERKILGVIHRRRGPNKIGVFGLLQPLSDGFKLIVKEVLYPSSVHAFIFGTAPIIFFLVSVMNWGIVPFARSSYLAQMNIGILYLFAVSSIAVYGVIMSGWSSNSKYSFLGGLRSSAQMVSYEIILSFSIVCICSCTSTFEFQEVVLDQINFWNWRFYHPLLIIFLISALAETNRHPFDLPEAEAELVSGYNVEYSAVRFALFSLGEYSNMLIMSSFIIILFFGGWLSPIDSQYLVYIPDYCWFSIKVSLCILFFIVTRAALPRYRYDQLMKLGWRIYLPAVICFFLYTFSIIYMTENFAF
jgi:NADH-quinone oxidoreductase subunit H